MEGLFQKSYLLQVFPLISSLDLSWNELGSNCAQFAYLAAGLMVNTGVQELDLRCNGLERECSHALGDALMENRGIAVLDLRWNNRIGNIGGQWLMKAVSRRGLVTCSKLSDIKTDGCNINSEITEVMNSWLKLGEERRRSFQIEERAMETVSHKVKEASAVCEKKVQILNQQLRKKDREFLNLQENWQDQMNEMARELESSRGAALSAKGRVATYQSELALERQLSAELKEQLENALTNAKQSTRRAVAAESKLNTITQDFEKQQQMEKSQLEAKSSDLGKEVERLKNLLEESREQRNSLEEKIAKLAAEKTSAEMEAENAKNGAEIALVRERSIYQERLDMLEKRWRDAVQTADNERVNSERQHSSALRDAVDEMSRLQRSVREMSEMLSVSQDELARARDEANAAKRKAEKATVDSAVSVDEFESVRSKVEKAAEKEKQLQDKIVELEAEVEKWRKDALFQKQKLVKLVSNIQMASKMAHQFKDYLTDAENEQV